MVERGALGREIRALRVLRGLTVMEAARRAGVSRVSLHRWEAGEQEPGGEALGRLLGALEADARERARVAAEAEPHRAAASLVEGPLGPPAHPGHLLRALREARGIGQGALAANMGLSRQAVAKWEAGSAMPNAETLGRALAALGGEEMELREGSLDLYDPIVDPFDARTRIRDRRFPDHHPLGAPRLLAIERELWPLAARDPHWEEPFAEALAWRSSYHFARYEHSLALEVAGRAMRLAASSGCWDAVYLAAFTLSHVRRIRGLSWVRLRDFWQDYAGRVKDARIRAFALAELSNVVVELGDHSGRERALVRAEALVREAEPNELYEETYPHSPYNSRDYDCFRVFSALDRGDRDEASRIYDERIASGWGHDWERGIIESAHDSELFVNAYVELHLGTGQALPERALQILDANARAAHWGRAMYYSFVGPRLGIHTPDLPKPR